MKIRRRRKKQIPDPAVYQRLAELIPELRPVPDVDPERLNRAVHSRKPHRTTTDEHKEVRRLRSL